MESALTLFWFRRDLRLEDNTALSESLKSGHPVMGIFIFDTHIIDELPDDDPRINFIYEQLFVINRALRSSGSSLVIYRGDPLSVWKQILKDHRIGEVYFNRDYEPYAIARDEKIGKVLADSGIPCHSFKDQVMFEKDEVVKPDGDPYTVFTPYKNRWLSRFNESGLPAEKKVDTSRFIKHTVHFPTLQELGFRESAIQVKDYSLDVADAYESTRNFPAMDGTSLLSPHLRFGTVSIRHIIRQLPASSTSFLNELIWREFFMQILFHFPDVVNENFRRKYDGIPWRNNEKEFAAWCEGRTGYPMVDAGMRQLNQSGWMHNRVRMVVAGFLCKHLMIDWRWGEAYFAQKLLDYELSSNNGNWQWAAGTGCDAAPYFRVFNPSEQLKKFDRDQVYVKQWIPELNTPEYPEPMVDHAMARERAIDLYRQGINS